MHERWPRIRVAWITPEDRDRLRGANRSISLLEELAGPRILAIADGEAPIPDSSPIAWSRFRFRRAQASPSVPELTESTAILVVRVFAEEADRGEFRRWLDDEHARLQCGIPGVRWYLGYEEEGSAHSFLNVWGLDDPRVADGRTWAAVRDTPWWRRVGHITDGADRGIYRPA